MTLEYFIKMICDCDYRSSDTGEFILDFFTLLKLRIVCQNMGKYATKNISRLSDCRVISLKELPRKRNWHKNMHSVKITIGANSTTKFLDITNVNQIDNYTHLHFKDLKRNGRILVILNLSNPLKKIFENRIQRFHQIRRETIQEKNAWANKLKTGQQSKWLYDTIWYDIVRAHKITSDR